MILDPFVLAGQSGSFRVQDQDALLNVEPPGDDCCREGWYLVDRKVVAVDNTIDANTNHTRIPKVVPLTMAA